MGSTIYVEMEKDGEVQCIREEHALMCKLGDELDQLALSCNVTPLLDFCGGTDLDFAEDFFVEGTVLEEPEPEWFAPESALETMDALIQRIQERPDLFTFDGDSTRSHWRANLLDELEHCRSVLKSASEAGQRFHFAIIM